MHSGEAENSGLHIGKPKRLEDDGVEDGAARGLSGRAGDGNTHVCLSLRPRYIWTAHWKMPATLRESDIPVSPLWNHPVKHTQRCVLDRLNPVRLTVHPPKHQQTGIASISRKHFLPRLCSWFPPLPRTQGPIPPAHSHHRHTPLPSTTRIMTSPAQSLSSLQSLAWCSTGPS